MELEYQPLLWTLVAFLKCCYWQMFDWYFRCFQNNWSINISVNVNLSNTKPKTITGSRYQKTYFIGGFNICCPRIKFLRGLIIEVLASTVANFFPCKTSFQHNVQYNTVFKVNYTRGFPVWGLICPIYRHILLLITLYPYALCFAYLQNYTRDTPVWGRSCPIGRHICLPTKLNHYVFIIRLFTKLYQGYPLLRP